jgi:hypothetical protein
MRFRALGLALTMAALATAAELPAQQPGAASLDTAQKRLLASTLFGQALGVAQYALLPEDLPRLWGPRDLLDEQQRLRLSAEQRHLLEALDNRMEEAFLSALSIHAAPDSMWVGTLWGDAVIDAADLARAARAHDEWEKTVSLELARIREEVLSVLTPMQRAEFLRHEAETTDALLTVEVRSAGDAAQFLERMAEAGMLPHPLLVGRSRAAELGLSPAELQRLDGLHAYLLAALDSLRGDTRLPLPSFAEVQAAVNTGEPWNHHVLAFATTMLHLRDATYQALADESAAALKQLQADMALLPFRPRKRPARPCLAGGMTGGGVLHDSDSPLHYDAGLTFQGDTAEIRILVIGRGDGGRFRRTDRSVAHERFGAGFSMGRWFIGHEEEAARLWLQDTPVELGDANVVILDLGDVPDGESPRVVALLRIDPRLPTGGCAEANISEILREFVLGHPDLQRYLRR